jgi:hypothetical protein
MRARGGPPRSATSCLFRHSPHPPGPDPRTFLSQLGRTIGLSVEPSSSERSPSFRFTSVPCRSPGTPSANSLPTSPRPQLTSLKSRPTRHVQITYTFNFFYYENNLFQFFFVLFLGSFFTIFAFTKTNKTTTENKSNFTATRSVSHRIPHKDSISRCHTKYAQGALSLFYPTPSISRARV